MFKYYFDVHNDSVELRIKLERYIRELGEKMLPNGKTTVSLSFVELSKYLTDKNGNNYTGITIDTVNCGQTVLVKADGEFDYLRDLLVEDQIEVLWLVESYYNRLTAS